MTGNARSSEVSGVMTALPVQVRLPDHLEALTAFGGMRHMMCEKCWGDAYMDTLDDPHMSQGEAYRKLLAERKDKPCTPKQQAGQWWDEEKQRDSRLGE